MRKCRLGEGLRQKGLAERLGVNEMTIVNWEKGRREPCRRYIDRIEGLFKEESVMDKPGKVHGYESIFEDSRN